MTTDNEQQGYDELRWLAKDTRTKRRRAMWWTAGLVLGAMAVATAYVRSNPGPNPAVTDRQTVSTTITNLPELTNIEEALQNIQGILRGANFGPQITVEVDVAPAPTPPGEPQLYSSSFVWFVDGTRRVPVQEGDTIWIHEASIWVRLLTRGTENTPDHTDPAKRNETVVEIWGRDYGSEPGQRLELPQYVQTNEEETGVADCIEIAARGPSTRPGFRGVIESGVPVYHDIEILFYNNESCGQD